MKSNFYIICILFDILSEQGSIMKIKITVQVTGKFKSNGKKQSMTGLKIEGLGEWKS